MNMLPKLKTRTIAFLVTCAIMLAAVGLVAFPSMRARAATYGVVLLNNGTDVWQWLSTVGGQLALNANAVQVWAIDQNGGQYLNLFSAAGTALPTCNTAHKGYVAAVSDASSPTYGGTYTSGSTTFALVICTGSAWQTH